MPPFSALNVVGSWLTPEDLCRSERRIYYALAHGPKTIAEIEQWGSFAGHNQRRRQQTVCRSLHRLIAKKLVEKTSRTRQSTPSGWHCYVYRLTRSGELLWGSG